MKHLPMTQRWIAMMTKHYCTKMSAEEKDRFIDACTDLVQVGHQELCELSKLKFKEIKSEIKS